MKKLFTSLADEEDLLRPSRFRGVESHNREPLENIDEKLREWRQGDCVLGDKGFLFKAYSAIPLSDAAKHAASESEGEIAVDEEVEGLCVVTQTCDIVRPCSDRKKERFFVEVSPLVEVEKDMLKAINRFKSPRYAYIHGVADRNLVADLDRVMTVEKPIVANWERTPGWVKDEEIRQIQHALERKRSRFAFPDKFNTFVMKLAKHLVEKHDKESEEGQLIRSIREIRVRASPEWKAKVVELKFWFLINEHLKDGESLPSWTECSRKWSGKLICNEKFAEEHTKFQLTHLSKMCAKDYLESERLDLEYLSIRT